MLQTMSNGTTVHHYNGTNQANNDADYHAFSWEPCNAIIRKGWATENIQEPFQCTSEWSSDVQVSVTLEKPFSWDPDKKEWRWHKTWRIPEIIVRVHGESVRYNCEVRVMMVCHGVHQSNELEDVGVGIGDTSAPQGGACLQVVDGECRFTRLRLLGTSNTHGGRRFHILVSLVQRNHVGAPKVLASLISTGFSVYSRKDADKKRKKVNADTVLGGKQPSNYISFSPEQFTREFIKKVSENGKTIEEVIDNSWSGLMRYFQAPNIRFKSRHPVLLATRFSNVIVVMRDSFQFPVQDELALRTFFCSCDFPTHCKIPNCSSCSMKQAAAISGNTDVLAPWCITMRPSCVCPPEAFRWLAEHLSCVKGPALGFVADPSMLPSSYISTDNINDMAELYSKIYALENSTKAIQGKAAKVEGADDERFNQLESDDDLAEKPEPIRVPNFDEERNETVRGAFAEQFINFHSELRALSTKLNEAASTVVADISDEAIEELRNAYFEFTEVLAVHAFVEDTILFPELSKRVPGVTEAYNYDHYKESDHLTRIHNSMNTLSTLNAAELFLKINGFVAIHEEHMEKEEDHLLPYFLSMFSDDELIMLMRKTSEATNNTRAMREMADQVAMEDQ